MKIAIIGTGPSGWAAGMQLLRLGFEITLIDSALVEDDDHNNSKKPITSSLTKKLYFGSDLPYRKFPFGPDLTAIGVDPISSFTSGGLSLVWGATMLPYCKADTIDWPFDISVLNGKFREISELLPIAGNTDQLDEIYGNFVSRRGIFPSRRMLQLLERANKNKIKGSLVGLSRLAVETGTMQKPGCSYCNQCISGCPSNMIWNSKGMTGHGNHVKMRVMKLTEVENHVYVDGLGINGETISTLCFDKVFLGTGSVESFRILANSGIVSDSAILQDSSTFFLPLFALPKIGTSEGNSFGLSQCFIRIDGDTGKSGTQFQLYEYSDDLILRARKALPFGNFIPTGLLKCLLSKLVVAIGYLSSQESPSIHMQLAEDGSVELRRNRFGTSLKGRKKSIKSAILNLGNVTKQHGLIPLRFLSQIATPGEGVHFGSWLPMGKNCDTLGRPNGFKNIHVIDSSILPSIAAGPITFTVMANAMRIAEESVK